MRGNSERLIKMVKTGVWLVYNEGKFWKIHNKNDDWFIMRGKSGRLIKLVMTGVSLVFIMRGKSGRLIKTGDDWGMVGL